ncbi:MAG: hypothetical protein LIO62_07420 [Clostridiales bacterium]|nr:hypothetical protein [Clostridiales bacterium]
MKKIFSLIIIGCLVFTLFVPANVFAADIKEQSEWQDIVLSDEEFEKILSNNPNNNIITYASGLIDSYSIGISKSGSDLIIAGKTTCTSNVTKCGFTKVIVQRRSSSTASWSNYKTYSDLYKDARSYTLSKKLSVTSGYQYRVTCTHYAKKSLLSTEKIDNTSNIVTF